MKVLSLIGNLSVKQIEEIKKKLETKEIAMSYLSEIDPSLKNEQYICDGYRERFF